MNDLFWYMPASARVMRGINGPGRLPWADGAGRTSTKDNLFAFGRPGPLGHKQHVFVQHVEGVSKLAFQLSTTVNTEPITKMPTMTPRRLSKVLNLLDQIDCHANDKLSCMSRNQSMGRSYGQSVKT